MRITHLNLERNLLCDEGTITIVKALKKSEVLIYLNLSSNEIKPRGINAILEKLMDNCSIQELVLGTVDGGNANRVNQSTGKVLTQFSEQNKCATVLSMRGMGMMVDQVVDFLEKFREKYLAQQELTEKLEAAQNAELDALEKTY